MNEHPLTNRGLLQAALVIFTLFLAYRFVAQVAALALLLGVGLLSSVALADVLVNELWFERLESEE